MGRAQALPPVTFHGRAGAARKESKLHSAKKDMELPRLHCQHPGCVNTYVSNDGVRKHCKRYHPQWLALRDELRLPVSGPKPVALLPGQPAPVPDPVVLARKQKRSAPLAAHAARTPTHTSLALRQPMKRRAAEGVRDAVLAAAQQSQSEDDLNASDEELEGVQQELEEVEEEVATTEADKEDDEIAYFTVPPKPLAYPDAHPVAVAPPQPQRPPTPLPAMFEGKRKRMDTFWEGDGLPPAKRGLSLMLDDLEPGPRPASLTPPAAALTPSEMAFLADSLEVQDEDVADLIPALEQAPENGSHVPVAAPQLSRGNSDVLAPALTRSGSLTVDTILTGVWVPVLCGDTPATPRGSRGGTPTPALADEPFAPAPHA